MNRRAGRNPPTGNKSEHRMGSLKPANSIHELKYKNITFSGSVKLSGVQNGC